MSLYPVKSGEGRYVRMSVNLVRGGEHVVEGLG